MCDGISDKILDCVADNISTEQLRLGIQLDLSKHEIDRIKLDHRNTYDQTFAILEKWRSSSNEKSPEKQKAVLVEALGNIGRNDVVGKIDRLPVQNAADNGLSGAMARMSLDEGLSEADKRKIQQSFHELKHAMKCEEITTKLFSADVIGNAQKEKLASMDTESKKADYILDAVMRGTYGHLEILKDALKDTRQGHLANKLP